jgi:hypothetical protein
MKYIKLFEGFFDRDFGPRLWTETDDWEDWQKIVELETPEELERQEPFEIIQTFRYDDKINVFNPKYPWYILSYSVVKRFEADETRNSCINISLISRGSIIIYKFTDDRWMVELFTNDYYKFKDAKFFCDSYEGLINWIEDWREKIN